MAARSNQVRNRHIAAEQRVPPTFVVSVAGTLQGLSEAHVVRNQHAAFALQGKDDALTLERQQAVHERARDPRVFQRDGAAPPPVRAAAPAAAAAAAPAPASGQA